MDPLVSVVIPTHNAAGTIGRALQSVQRQTYSPIEILVVNDGSTDETPLVVDGLSIDNIELVTLDRSYGAAFARNVGIRQSRGAFVAFLDADDEWMPEKTARQMAQLVNNPNMTFVACAAGHVSEASKSPRKLNAHRRPATGRDAWKVLLAYTYVATPCVIARRQALFDVGMFETSFSIAEDQDLWIRLARAGEVGFIDDIMTYVNDTPGSLTKRQGRHATRTVLSMINRHIENVGSALSAAERNHILAQRYADLGRNDYVSGATRSGAILILKAILRGHAPFANSLYLVSAAPALRWLKQKITAPA